MASSTRRRSGQHSGADGQVMKHTGASTAAADEVGDSTSHDGMELDQLRGDLLGLEHLHDGFRIPAMLRVGPREVEMKLGASADQPGR
jgi:hypothetical protein